MRNIKFNKSSVLDYIQIIAGTALLAIAISVFFEPNDMVTGGVTGLSIIIADYSEKLGFPIGIWALNLVLNVPLFLIGSKVKGFKFLAKTLFATIFLSVVLYLSGFLPVYTGDLTISAIFGGVASGVGLGLVFRAQATTGGTDLAASIINNYFPHVSLQRIMFLLDSAIIALGFFLFGATPAFYAIVTVFITTKVVDTVLEGLDFAKALFIISDKSDDISKVILDEIGRGVTALYGKGMYSGSDKNVLLCVMNVKQIVEVKRIVNSIDKNAFVIVADVREVIGDF